MKKIILCADDYGQNSEISQAIIELLEKNRLSATSCLSSSLDWPIYANFLKFYRKRADIGLHFNLTEGTPVSSQFRERYGSHFPSLSKLMIQSHLRMLDPVLIHAEFSAQMERFSDVMGQFPDFIDGHQHVHQFPVIRDVVIAGWEKYLKKYGAYIRSTVGLSSLAGARMRSAIVRMGGAKSLSAELNKHRIPHNVGFTGMYDFSKSVHYSRFFPLFLQEIQDGGLIMCHPGLDSDDSLDSIRAARYHEYSYFMSEQFDRHHKIHNIKLVRFKDFI